MLNQWTSIAEFDSAKYHSAIARVTSISVCMFLVSFAICILELYALKFKAQYSVIMKFTSEVEIIPFD